MEFRQSNANLNLNRNPCSSSESELECGSNVLGEMELGAARALADFALMAKIERESGEIEDRESRREKKKKRRIKKGSPARVSDKSSGDLKIARSAHAYLVDDAQDSKAVMEMEERIKIEQNTEFSNISCSSSHVSCFGRRVQQNMTEAEREAKRIRRVLANRESARQTINRRQALREELIKRVADLSLENENLKSEKEVVMKEYFLLKVRNKELKSQMSEAVKPAVEVRTETPLRHVEMSTSPSTELSLVAPIAWPTNSSEASASNMEAGSSEVGPPRTLFYMSPCLWLYPNFFHQTSSDNDRDFISKHQFNDNSEISMKETAGKEEERKTSINLEEVPLELAASNLTLAPDPGGTVSMLCPNVESEPGTSVRVEIKDRCLCNMPEKSQLPSIVQPLKKLVDPTRAAAARKRRKELTKLKYLRERQVRLHG